MNNARLRAVKDDLVPTCIELRGRNEGCGNVSTVQDIRDHTISDNVSHIEEVRDVAHSCPEKCLIVSDTYDDWCLESLKGDRIEVLDDRQNGASGTQINIHVISIG